MKFKKALALGAALVPLTFFTPHLQAADTLTILHSFAGLTTGLTNADGAEPMTAVTISGNTVYGTTAVYGPGGGGTLFKVNSDGSGFTNIHVFTPFAVDTGAFPATPLLLVSNVLYGAARADGPGGNGVIFSINADGTGYTILHSFSGGLPDGGTPAGNLIITNNTLYGTAFDGGTNGSGSVFALDLDNTNNFTNVYNFTGGHDGMGPESGVVLLGNTLFGAANSGGDTNNGTLFSVNTDGTGFTVLHEFSAVPVNGTKTNADGAYPGSLVAVDGTLYGTAEEGGPNATGTIYSITPGGVFKVIHPFSAFGETLSTIGRNSDGAGPIGGLTAVGSVLYGTAILGGEAASGTIYSLNPDGSGFSVLSDFATSTKLPAFASGPYAPVVFADNALFGTTDGGGLAGGGGTVFRLSFGPPPPTLPQFQAEPPATQTVGLSSPLLINSYATADVPVTYQWYLNNKAVGGATGDTLDIKSASAASAGTYYVVAKDAAGSVTSSVDVVTVKILPIITTQPPKLTTTELGADLTLSAKATGPSLTYQWFLDNGPLEANESGASNVLSIKTVTRQDPGNYTLVVSNPNGSVTSSIASLVLKSELTKPSITILNPKASTRTTNSILDGTASDAVAVAGVNYWITNYSFSAPVTLSGAATLTSGKGASNWSVPMPLPGSNVLGVQSYNYAGLSSPVLYSKFFYEVPNPFTLGYLVTDGTVTGKPLVAGGPLPTNGAKLYIGDPYELSAQPLKGFIFTGWELNYGYATNYPTNASIAFLMESNLVVTANFAAAPAPAGGVPSGVIMLYPNPGTGGNQGGPIGGDLVGPTFPSLPANSTPAPSGPINAPALP